MKAKILGLLVAVGVLLSGVSSVAVADGVIECQDCDGKLTTMVLRHYNDYPVYLEVYSHKGVELFSGTVNPYQIITLSGADNYRDRKSTLGPNVFFSVDGVEIGSLHTSCSVEIGPGTRIGDFVVLVATSRNGGLTCPVDEIPPCTSRACFQV